MLLSFAVLALSTLVTATEPAGGPLVVVGGGTTPVGLHRKLIELGGGTNAHVLVIPFASATDTGDSSLDAFRKAGAVHVSVLAARVNHETALTGVHGADIIWFPGGLQSRLMDELNRLNMIEAIRRRHAQGAVIGGTSAGAAVMSPVMICGKPQSPGDPPPMFEGLGLWPGVIVDQHFVKRGRESRLRNAVKVHPHLIGVGIDESTYVVVRGKTAEVFGRNTVTLVDERAKKAEPKITMLKAGAVFHLAEGVSR